VRVLEEKQAAQLVPEPIYNGIWEENMAFFQDKNIFDPDYFDFLWSCVKLDRSPAIEDATLTPDLAHPTMRAIELGCRFIVETLAHAKEKGSLPSYVSHLKTLFSRHLPASRVHAPFFFFFSKYVKWLISVFFLSFLLENSGCWRSWRRT
jgi:hypothetical protein